MATSPLFGWQEPDDTSLVKDGAAAIRTLGNAIDSSMGDLLGGTTGQVLAKASNTNMDFTWVAQDDSNAIQNTIVDAKGDLIAASANDTPARLAVGNNGETLVADSSTSTGLRYTGGTVQSNPVINSAFQVWQRGTSVSATNQSLYTADRWMVATGASMTCTISRQATGDTTNLPFIQYCARVQRNSGQTATGNWNIQQSMESINSIPFAGKTVTLSFYARKGANFSASGDLISIGFYSGTGTDQNFQNGYTGTTNIVNTTQAITTTWVRYSFTGSVAATATEMALVLGYTATGTAGAADFFEITGIQIDVGSVALPFRTYAGTIQGESAACQRYFVRLNTNSSSFIGQGMARSGTVYGLFGSVPLPTSMRTAPSLSVSGLQMEPNAGGGFALNGVVTSSSPNNAGFYGDRTGNWTGDHGLLLRGTSSNNYLDASSEL